MTLERPLHVRFIEYMPVGEAEEGAGCTSEIAGMDPRGLGAQRRGARAPLGRGRLGGARRAAAGGAEKTHPAAGVPRATTASPSAKGTIGVISPLSHHFCAECNRLRLTADGRLRPCLFSDNELDVRTVLRTGTDEDVRAVVREALRIKPENHAERVGTSRRMSQIGG